MMRFALLATVLALAIVSPRPAAAHPHVWVTMKTEMVYGPDGALTGLRQAWTFDDAFSAFALQGLERRKDGTYGDDVLKPLAQVNVESLKEYDYFVTAKSATTKLAFNEPVDYYLTYADDLLTLHFTLPLKKPQPAKGTVSVDIYDPTYFISFTFTEKDPVKLVGAPASCTEHVVSPEQQTVPLDENFFASLNASSTFGAQYADKITVKCP
ncbi:DUF1007 family protein [Xanthobacter agilis]|jgi:ABC-type uncharacterized transport system substrate-binding protein|uniref:ABC-type uncharacterized transport system substrate-binding protein n=1 Tax=Xanthobacter agilis TaxID=47492 RepID=A0ABU0L9R4_XANAG|nr:DUF1007 family protein [Xanthobacter agilis]MDQ0503805.1 ABC-type uncharacterized transport system substrate-binding protein [Xanthobacter agilis]